MFLLFIVFLLAVVYCGLFYFTNLSLWFYFLWVPLSILLSIITVVGITALMFQVFVRTKNTGKVRHWLLYEATGIILLFLRVKVEVEGRENIPNETFVCYANHKSYIDAVVIYRTLHRVCAAIGKKSLFKIPVLKQFIPAYGCLALDRDDDRAAARTFIEAIKNIKNGLSYFIFPEGGIKTIETEQMVDLKPGAYKLVTKTGVKLLPCCLIGSSTFATRKHIFKKMKVKIIFYKPIGSEVYENCTTQEIGTMVMDIINKDVQEHENKKNN